MGDGVHRPASGANVAKMMDRISFWDWLPLPLRSWRVVLHVAAADEIPERLPFKGAVTVGPHGRALSWIAFDCPCGRGHRVMLNLDASRAPRWKVRSTRPLTIQPSVDDCSIDKQCHYFITQGKTIWAP